MTNAQADNTTWPFHNEIDGLQCHGKRLADLAADERGLRLLDRARDWQISNPRLREAIANICDRFAHEIDRLVATDS